MQLSQDNSSFRLHLQHVSTFHEYSPAWIERITSWVVCGFLAAAVRFSPVTHSCVLLCFAEGSAPGCIVHLSFFCEALLCL